MLYRITVLPSMRQIESNGSETMLQLLQRLGFPVLASCNSGGRCGHCRVRWLSSPPSATEAERARLSQHETNLGWRLACQHNIHADCEIWLPSALALQPDHKEVPHDVIHPEIARIRRTPMHVPALLSNRAQHVREQAERMAGMHLNWSSPSDHQLERLITTSEDEFPITVITLLDTVIHVARGHVPIYGVALDIGTTTVGAYLVDLDQHLVVESHGLMNSQTAHGADVMSRIAVSHSAEGREVLTHLIREDAQTLIQLLLQSVDADSASLVCGWFVGNPAMTHLFIGMDPSSLGRAPFEPQFRGGISLPADRLGIEACPGAIFSTLPIVGGFVGGDAVAVALSEENVRWETHLILDIGTNAEIMLLHGGRMHACSAAAGPALEGIGIQCGTIARAGAIHSFWFEDGLHYATIGKQPPIGICGSGLLDLLSLLLQYGVIHSSGRIQSKPAIESKLGIDVTTDIIHIHTVGKSLQITQPDIRSLQLAVAAIRAGITSLLSTAEVTPMDVQHITITGAFGFSLNSESLERLGLIHRHWKGRLSTTKNAAGRGAILSLLDMNKLTKASELVANAQHIRLEKLSDFSRTFIEAMKFPEGTSAK